MTFTQNNYGLTYSLILLLGLLVCCNLHKFFDNYKTENFQNDTPLQNNPVTTFNPDNYYCPHLQQPTTTNYSSNSNNINPVYCPGEHPNIPCQLVNRCQCSN